MAPRYASRGHGMSPGNWLLPSTSPASSGFARGGNFDFGRSLPSVSAGSRPGSAPSGDYGRPSGLLETRAQSFSRPSTRQSRSRSSTRPSSRSSTSLGRSSLSVGRSERPPSLTELRSKLDASLSPAMVSLRQNSQNVKKRLMHQGLSQATLVVVPPMEKLRLEIRGVMAGRDWNFLETIQVIEFRDALEHKCGVPSGTFRNRTFMKLLTEEVQRFRAQLLRTTLQHAETEAVFPSLEQSAHDAMTSNQELMRSARDSEPGKPCLRRSSSQANVPEGCEPLWASTFNRLKHDGELNVTDLPTALELIGIPKPSQTWIDQVLHDQGFRFATLSVIEWTTVVQGYKELQRAAFKEEFDRFDEDGSGELSTDELRDLLLEVGVEPLPTVLREVIDEVDADGSGTVGFEEFEEVMNLIRVREGFTKREVEDMHRAFAKFDRDKSGEVDIDELLGVLSWLGYNQSEEEVREVAAKVDFDGSGCVSKEELLLCMRKLQQQEVQNVKAIMRESDTDGSGTISVLELRSVLKKMGYTLSPDVLRECMEDAGVTGKPEMDFDDVWSMFTLYRERQGFLSSEVEDMQRAFDKYDKDGKGEMNSIALGRIMRWLGHPTHLAEQQVLVAQVDVDHSGLLDFSEFMKLMRNKGEREFRTNMMCFLHFTGPDSFMARSTIIERKPSMVEEPDGELEEANGSLMKALRYLGIYNLPKDMHPGVNGNPEEVNFEQFIKIIKRHNAIQRERFQQNAGFTDSQTLELKAKFDVYDRDRSGDISNRELHSLLHDLYPGIAESKEGRPKLQRIMEEIDQDGDGHLDFGDFLRLNRQYLQECEQQQLEKENQAVEDTGFTKQEVEGFRILFKKADERAGAEGQLTPSDLRKMINKIAPLGHAHMQELTKIIESTDEDMSHTADFPEFLRIMKKVQEMNLANVMEASLEHMVRSKGTSDRHDDESSVYTQD